jgi:hypothetical protein
MDQNDLINKIRLQKGLHSYYEMKKKPLAISVKVVLIVIPALTAFLSIADIDILKIFFPSINEKHVLVSISLVSLFLFIISVLTDIFGIDEKYKEHRIAINQLIKLRKSYQNEIEDRPDNSNEITRKYNDIYSEIVNTFPEFTDRQYKKGKEYYIKRLEEKKDLENRLKKVRDN